jgi:hypothetical protein
VHDGVDLLVLEDEVEEVGGLDVALDELRRGSGGGEGVNKRRREKRGRRKRVECFFFQRRELSSPFWGKRRASFELKKKEKRNKTGKMAGSLPPFWNSNVLSLRTKVRETRF